MIAKLLLCLVGLNHISLSLVHATGGDIPDDLNVTLAEVTDLLDSESYFRFFLFFFSFFDFFFF